jgi:hypothetical protein
MWKLFSQVADLFLGICHPFYRTCYFHGDLCRESLLAFQGQISIQIIKYRLLVFVFDYFGLFIGG